MYFYDTGLVCALLNIREPETLHTHFLRGALFETVIMSELFKHHFNKMQKPPLYYWRDKTGHEVDCIVDTEGRLLPIEIKSGSTIQPKFFKNIRYYLKLSQGEAGYIIYAGDNRQMRNGIKVIPWLEAAETQGE